MLSLKTLITLALTLGISVMGLTTVKLDPGTAAQLGGALNAAGAKLGLTLSANAGAQTQAQISHSTIDAGANSQAQTQATVKTQTNARTQPSSNVKANANTKTNVNAAVNATLNKAATNANVNADNSLKVATAIANKFGVAVSNVTALHNSGWGYGDIEKLYEMAKTSGKSVTDIEAMRASGKGWGEIAASLNTSVSGPDLNLGAILSGQGTLKVGRK